MSDDTLEKLFYFWAKCRYFRNLSCFLSLFSNVWHLGQLRSYHQLLMLKLTWWDGRVRRRLRELMGLLSSTMEQGAIWEFPYGFPHSSQVCQWSCCSGSWVPLINTRPGAVVGEVGLLLLVQPKWQTRGSLLPTHKLEVLLKTPFLGILNSVKMLFQ